MESAFVTALIFLLFGGILLFFGSRLVRLIIGIYGAMAGYWLGHELMLAVDWWGWLEVVIVALTTVVVSMFAVAFYKFLVEVAIAFFVFSVSYGIIVSLGGNETAALVFTAIAGIISYFIVRRNNLATALFAIITAIYGAALLVAGSLLLFEPSSVEVATRGQAFEVVTSDWVWTLIWAGLTVLGIVAQAANSDK